MIALILAAGYATRLYPYTLTSPKPLLNVSGRPIIDYITNEILTLPMLKKIVVISNNKFYSQFKEWEKTRSLDLIKVLNDGSDTVDDRLGAIGDIYFAIEKENVNDDIVIIAGDNLFTFKLLNYYNYFKQSDSNCICVKEIDDYEALKQLGVAKLNDKDRVVGFTEKPKQPDSKMAAFAIYMFKKNSLSLINEYLKSKDNKDAPGFFIEWLHKKTNVYAYKIDGECYDIGTVSAYENIRDSFRNLC